MEPELIIKFVLALAAIVTIGKVIYDFILGNKSKLREEYRFAKEFLNDSIQKDQLHPFVMEKGYQAIAGTTTVKSKEVAYILSLENSANCLKDYVLSKKYLEHLETNGNLNISFSKKYKAKWSRTWRKSVYLAIYIICSLIAVSPIIVRSIYDFNTGEFTLINIIVIPIFIFFAFNSLISFAKIYRGEKLVKNQKNTHKTL